MATSTNPNAAKYGLYVPTTNIWDVSEIYQLDVNTPQFKELLVRLYQNINNIALSLNLKDTGIYDTGEYVCGRTYFPNPSLDSTTSTTPTFRNSSRLLINFGALPNTGTKSVPHNLSPNSAWTFSYPPLGAASDTTGLNYISVPYASPVLANNIELNVDSTNVNITTGSNRSNFNVCYVILEYLKT